MANWRPLVHWLLDIPHLIVANALAQVASVIALVSWFFPMTVADPGDDPLGVELRPRPPFSTS